jgi:RNA polymerase-binding transcription factor DksA
MRYNDIRQKIASRENELRNIIRRIDERTRVPLSEYSGELSAYDNHTDLGIDLFNRETDQVIRHEAKKKLEDLDAAKRSLEEGVYGVCQNCGIPIESDRLNALPESRTCISCAENNQEERLYLLPQGNLEPNEFWDEMAVWGNANSSQDGQEDVEKMEDEPL